MKWPWASDVDEAHRQAESARRQHEESTQRRIAATSERKKAVKVTKALRADLDANGWTELLRQAWGGTTP